jgi:hypothetical protein
MSTRLLAAVAMALVMATGTACKSATSGCTGATPVRVVPTDTTLALNKSFTATVAISSCDVPGSNVVTWRSTNPLIAAVESQTGRVTGLSVGETRILATSQRYGELGPINVFVYNDVNPTPDEARAELRYYIEHVTQATRQYRGRDDAGHPMDGLKISPSPDAGGFIAVYHAYRAGTFDVHLATSSDLMNWRWRTRLSTSASQPTIKAAGSGYVVVWETDGDNHLQFAYYDSGTDLLNAVASKTFGAPRTLSPCAEGTPNIYDGSSASVDVGFHYYWNCDVDRQARGTTDWTSWSASAQPAMDNAILAHGVTGNIGDRDGVLTFRGYGFGLIEGQLTKGEWGAWRVFLYDYQAGTAELLNIQTDAGSTAFGNPTIEQVHVGARSAIVITLFLFSEGARGGEDGPLIYYRIY